MNIDNIVLQLVRHSNIQRINEMAFNLLNYEPQALLVYLEKCKLSDSWTDFDCLASCGTMISISLLGYDQ
jgi:hypothetical protein